MKKLIASFIACFMIGNVLSITVTAETNPSIVVNGKEIRTSAVIRDSRTLVPVRGVFESLGYNVMWDEVSKTATIKNDTYEIKIQNGRDTFTCNGQVITPDVSQQNIDSRFYLPLRAVSESIKADVSWDETTKTVNIKTIKDEVIEVPNVEIEKPISEQNKEEVQDTSKDKTLIGTNPMNGKPIYKVGGCEDFENTPGYSNGILVNGKRIWFDMSYKEAEQAIGISPKYGDGKTWGTFVDTSIGDIQIAEIDGEVNVIELYASQDYDVQYGNYLYTHMDGEMAAEQDLGGYNIVYNREPALVIEDCSIRDSRGYTYIPITISPQANSSVLTIKKEIIEF